MSYSKLALTMVLTLMLTVSTFAQENSRPTGLDGVNVFETVGTTDGEFEGVNVFWGAAFTQQFQTLGHSNDGSVELLEIGNGFNLATANLNLSAELSDGITVFLETYLSSQHHSETWVKGGYLQIDNVPFERLQPLFNVLSARVGHMEVNYGDAHFNRSDNGSTIYNPFVGNLIMDSFATEIGAEVYARRGNLLAMVGMTGGEIKGATHSPDDRAPSFLGKLAYDNQVSDGLRVRLAGSVYTTEKSLNNTLYSGDRAGSRFYNVLVEGNGDNFRAGRFNPGFRSKVTAYQVNPFVQFGNLEVRGVYEVATGNAADKPEGTFTQKSVEGLYRFGSTYVGARKNWVDGEGKSIDRVQVVGGWFVTDNILTKVNYVKQTYDKGFSGILADGQFDGFTIEGVVTF